MAESPAVNGRALNRNSRTLVGGVSRAIADKYPSQVTRAAVEAGDAWMFEAAPRQESAP